MFVQMVAINDWFKYKGWITYTWINSFGFPWRSDDAIVINNCILYAKHHIYLEKLKENKNQNAFNIDFLGYLSKLKYILKIEKSICTHNNQSIKFNKFNFIYDNL